MTTTTAAHSLSRLPLWLTGVLTLLACGGSSSSSTVGSGLPNGFYVRISGMAFSPVQLEAPPGATVTVLNADGAVHTVTSEAASGNFTPGAFDGIQFDTGNIPGNATGSFQLPAGAHDGDVVFYYCNVHKGAMATPNGSVKVNAAAQPGPAPGGGGGMGGGGY